MEGRKLYRFAISFVLYLIQLTCTGEGREEKYVNEGRVNEGLRGEHMHWAIRWALVGLIGEGG